MTKSGVYTPRPAERQANKTTRKKDASGRSPRDILLEEAHAQRAVAENERWLIAKKQTNPSGDSLLRLGALGFTSIISSPDDLFYEVVQPDQWTKSTEGYWTSIKDVSGIERGEQYYKADSAHRNAFIFFPG